VEVRYSTTPNGEKRTDQDLDQQWNSINWNEIKSRINRLQTRIAKATQERKWNLVKRLTYLLTHSHSAKLLAVWMVTQNHGKRTPGIDGELWNTASEKMHATLSLTDKKYCSQPLRRIYIPKPGKDTKRPISIPTMHDRAMQTLYALALQPVAETTADPRSFGYRLFRCAQDAGEYIFKCISLKRSAHWILEGDIRGCFDNISHDWLMENIPMDRSILAQFLKPGFIFDKRLFSTDKGTPQGGVISPILANIALDGIEMIISERFPNMKVHYARFADDFIVTAPSKETAEEIREHIRGFLADRGLELSPEKTMISHIDDGFDFLGWNFRKYRGILIIKPSRKSVDSITQKIKMIIKKGQAWTQDELICALNPVIIGWTNYHRHNCAKETFQKVDNYMWICLAQWARKRHPKKGYRWIANRYWHSVGNRKWVFKTDQNKLIKFSDTEITRHRMPKLNANPYLERDYFLERKDRIMKRTPWIQTRLSFFAFRRPTNGL
jgi:RNA-directed DNA polymerase